MKEYTERQKADWWLIGWKRVYDMHDTPTDELFERYPNHDFGLMMRRYEEAIDRAEKARGIERVSKIALYDRFEAVFTGLVRGIEALKREEDGMNNKTFPQHIREVADQMSALAERMAKEGGTAAVHAVELAGAANIARTWANGIEGEEA